MAFWLFKEEPSHFNFTDLERSGEAAWDGVKNALALIHLRAVRPGDRVLLYQTGKEKAVVGEMKATAAKDGVVTVKPVRRLHRSVTLAEIKTQPICQTWELVRNSRLSVMPVPEAIWTWITSTAQTA
jgi:predicted RNA-binding protein with PUA-like domain